MVMLMKLPVISGMYYRVFYVLGNGLSFLQKQKNYHRF